MLLGLLLFLCMTMVLGRQNHDEISKWPNPVMSTWNEGSIDFIAPLNERVKKEKADAFLPFNDKRMSVEEILLSGESISFLASMNETDLEGMEKALFGHPANKELERILLEEEK